MADLVCPPGVNRVTGKDGNPYTIFNGIVLDVPESQVPVLLEAGFWRSTLFYEDTSGPMPHATPTDADDLTGKLGIVLVGLARKGIYNAGYAPTDVATQVVTLNHVLAVLGITDIARATAGTLLDQFNLLLAELQAHGLMASA